MKRILFAVQIFGLIVLLPSYVVLEMNHGTRPASSWEAKPIAEKSIEQTSTGFSSSSIAASPIAFLALKANIKSKKKTGGTCCTCKPCHCGANCTCADL